MAHLSRNISDSENPVVSYQPSWFDDGAAAQLHRVSQLRWIDLYIYIYLSSPAGGSVLVWLAPTDELLVCWKIHTIKIDDFLSDTPPFWAGIFHPATFDYGGHVWKFWGDILRSQGHVEVDNPFSQKKKKLCAPSWCQDWESPCELWQRNTPTLDKLDKPPNVAVVSTDFSVITAVKIFTSRP